MGLFDIFKSKKKREEAKKYRIGMEKTRKSIFGRLFSLFESKSKKLQDDFFDELEEVLPKDIAIKFMDYLNNL